MKFAPAFLKSPISMCSLRLEYVNACCLRTSQPLLRCYPRTAPSGRDASAAAPVIPVTEEVPAEFPCTGQEAPVLASPATVVAEYHHLQTNTRRTILQNSPSSTRRMSTPVPGFLEWMTVRGATACEIWTPPACKLLSGDVTNP